MKEEKVVRAKNSKKVGIIIATNDPETCWVAIRYASFHLVEQNDVKIYFVDSGLRHEDISEKKYNVSKLLEGFTKDGGKVYMCDDRDNLKFHLLNNFDQFLNRKEIIGISDDDKIQSIMTENAYIREFKRVL